MAERWEWWQAVFGNVAHALYPPIEISGNRCVQDSACGRYVVESTGKTPLAKYAKRAGADTPRCARCEAVVTERQHDGFPTGPTAPEAGSSSPGDTTGSEPRAKEGTDA